MRRFSSVTGSAFIEFNSTKTAKYFINEYNNKCINGHLFCLNWAKHNYKKNYKDNESENTNNINNIYTVRKYNYIPFVYIDIRWKFRQFYIRKRIIIIF